MAILIDADHRDVSASLFEGSFRLRKRILVDKLGWSLPSGDAPLERDEFDGDQTCHLVSLTTAGQVRGTLRATSSLAPNVSCDILGPLLGVDFPRSAEIGECSRFCVDLALPTAERRAARADLYVSYMELCAMRGWTRTLGILRMPSLQDFIRCGLNVECLSPPSRFSTEDERSVAFIMNSDKDGWDCVAATLGFRTALRLPARGQDWFEADRTAA